MFEGLSRLKFPKVTTSIFLDIEVVTVQIMLSNEVKICDVVSTS